VEGSCTGSFHRLKDCPQFCQMDLKRRMALVRRLKMPARSRHARPAITNFCTSKVAGNNRAEKDCGLTWEAARESEPAQKQQLLCAQASRSRERTGDAECQSEP
jgi:hypothetical protein